VTNHCNKPQQHSNKLQQHSNKLQQHSNKLQQHSNKLQQTHNTLQQTTATNHSNTATNHCNKPQQHCNKPLQQLQQHSNNHCNKPHAHCNKPLQQTTATTLQQTTATNYTTTATNHCNKPQQHSNKPQNCCELVHLTCYRICGQRTVRHHPNKPQKGGICVANHTSPIDIVILANDGCYAMVGQIHGGLMGVIQRSMVKACPHVWFERSDERPTRRPTRLRAHVAAKTKLPILIFPEGTCINNTSVMMFKKGSFEIGGTIYPVTIKYNPRFGDAFWNSSKYNMVSYLLRMMTSWAIVVNVWYLPPMTRQDGEDAAQFANRVKSAIADQGGLLDLAWDGGLKRGKVKDWYKEEQQKMYSSIIVGQNGFNSAAPRSAGPEQQ
uniref:Glycerol-3-phosphate acyltransferase 3 n=1 Tax=Sparus aurata TaxID=8175 RepID=A0A671VL39_SPAAU